MGGNVAWTVRLSDGTEFRMDRRTNIFSGRDGATTDDAFLSGDAVAIQKALEQWLEMKSDWEENHSTGNFQHNMTSVYAPYPFGLKPSEYGFFVTDFVNHTIISSQKYTQLFRDKIYPGYVEPEKISDEDTNVYGDPLIDSYNEFVKLYEAGRITHYTNNKNQEVSAQGLTLEELIDLATEDDPRPFSNIVKGKPRHPISYVQFQPLEPWVCLDFDPYDKSQRQAAYDAVLKLDFKLSDQEEVEFKHWIDGKTADDED